MQIIIDIEPETGKFQVTGPVQDKIFMLGVLSMAAYFIMSQKSSPIVHPGKIPISSILPQ